MKAGRRRGGELLITHALATDSGSPARFGFIVSKAVGSAVRRNTVKRRLRALSAERIAAGSSGVDVVVRALPAAAAASFEALRAEMTGQLGSAA